MIDHPVVVVASAISLPVLVVGAVRLYRGTGGELALRLLYRDRRIKSGYGARAALVVGLVSVIAIWVVVADLWDLSMLPPLAALLVVPMMLHRMTEDISARKSGHDT